MNKFQYLVEGVRRRDNATLKWLLSILAYSGDTNPPPHYPKYEKDHVTVRDEDGKVVLDVKVKEYSPLFGINDKFFVEPGDLPNVTKRTETTVGIFIINANCLCDRLGDAIPYQNGILSDSHESNLIAEAVKEGKITIEQSTLAIRNRHWLTGIMQTVLPSATERAVVPRKDIRAHKEKRLKDDPSIITDTTKAVELEDELVAMDKEHIKGDDSELFYKSGKAYNVTRKRMFGSFGLEKDPDTGNMRLLTGSLQEGISVSDAPYIFNSLRDGSFSRGAETQLGGEIVKFLLRIFEKTTIKEDDCGTVKGLEVFIDDISIPNLQGRYYIKAGKVTTLDSSALEANRNKKLTVRSPFACATKGGHYCKTCMGDNVAHSKNALSILAVEVGSAFVSLFLAKMHGTSYNLEEYNFEKHIR